MNKITIRIAVFEYTSWGTLSCLAGIQAIRKDGDNTSDLIRVSEWKDVEFDAIPIDDVMPEILAGIDKEIEQAEAKHNIVMQGLKQKKQELLAITLQPWVNKDSNIRTQENGDGTWAAWYNDDAYNYDGLGSSEQEAIDDLKANYEH